MKCFSFLEDAQVPNTKNINKRQGCCSFFFHFFFLLSGFQQPGVGPTAPETPVGSCPHAASVEVHLARPLQGCSSGLVFKVCSHNSKTHRASHPPHKELSSTFCPAPPEQDPSLKMTRTEMKWMPCVVKHHLRCSFFNCMAVKLLLDDVGSPVTRIRDRR